MSVANILGADGKIKALYFPGGEYPSGGGLTNPLTTDLLCAGFDVSGADFVRTNVVECETLEPKLPQTFIECVADLQLGVGNELRSERVVTDEVRVREGVDYADIAYGAGFNELKLRPADSAVGGSVSIQQGGGAKPTLNFYDVSAAVFGNVALTGANTLTSDSDIRVDKATPALKLVVDASGVPSECVLSAEYVALGGFSQFKMDNPLLITAGNGVTIQRISMLSSSLEVNGGGIVVAGAPTFATPFYINFNNNGVAYQIPCFKAP